VAGAVRAGGAGREDHRGRRPSRPDRGGGRGARRERDAPAERPDPARHGDAPSVGRVFLGACPVRIAPMEIADILARVRSAAPTEAPAAPEPEGPAGGISPLLIGAAAFALGILFALIVDWRSHAHPRD